MECTYICAMAHQFKVGQRIICVDDTEHPNSEPLPTGCPDIVAGSEYIVAWTEAPGVGLVGFPQWIGFFAWRFAPIDLLADQIHRIESEGCPVEQEEPVLT